MNPYSNETASKKKWLVPLVAVLMCGIAMTGAAYAYNSVIEGTGEGDVDYITLNFDNANAEKNEYDATTMHYTASAALTFNHTKSYDAKAKEIVEKYTADDKTVLFTVKVVLSKDASETENIGAPTVKVTSATAEEYGLEVHVGTAKKVENETAWTYEITISGDSVKEDKCVKPMSKIDDFQIKATSVELSD